MKCSACVARQDEIRDLEQKLTVLRRAVEECPLDDGSTAEQPGSPEGVTP